jgi:cell division protein FtsW
MSRKLRKHINNYDFSLIFIIAFLLVFGMIVLYSTSSYNALLENGDAAFYLKKQLRNTLIGIVAMIFVIKIDYHFWRHFALLGYIISIIFTLLVAFSPLGITLNGARRWLGTSSFSFQPAEFAKAALIIFLAACICSLKGGINNIKSLLILFFATVLLALFVWKFTDNLSSGIIVGGIGCVMLFVAYRDNRPCVIAGVGAAVFICVFLYYVFNIMDTSDPELSFRLERILAWRDPGSELYSSGTGYQTMQSLYAIGSGGLLGKGLGNSIQKLGFIPEAQNDMIFPIICEELGLFGAVSLLIIFAMLIWRMMLIACDAPDLFGAMIVTGVMGQIAIQVILNVAVVTNVIPNTGITLPFISYGGTSVIFLLAEMGLVINISGKRKLED